MNTRSAVLSIFTFETLRRIICCVMAGHQMKELKEFWKIYYPYFLDFWMYLVIIVGTIIAMIIFL